MIPRTWGWRSEREGTVSGEVCIVRLTACYREEESQLIHREPWRFLDGENLRLREKLQAAVRESLGGEFQITSLTMGRGSIEILAIIGTTFYAISRWKSFVESIELMVEQLKRVVQRTMMRAGPGEPVVTAAWTPGRGFVSAAPHTPRPRSEVASLVTWYLVLSHALMLAALLWLLLVGRSP